MPKPDYAPLTAFYNRLENMMDKVLEHQAAGSIRAIWLNGENPNRYNTDPITQGYLMVMQDSENEYTLCGCNVNVTFKPAEGKGFAVLGRTVEGTYFNGEWRAERWLNGDDVQLRYDILNAIDEGFSSQGVRFSGATQKILAGPGFSTCG